MIFTRKKIKSIKSKYISDIFFLLTCHIRRIIGLGGGNPNGLWTWYLIGIPFKVWYTAFAFGCFIPLIIMFCFERSRIAGLLILSSAYIIVHYSLKIEISFAKICSSV
ncbi:hypothetical protein BpHYR1_032279 [Brachionus plicatilis]|uniref:Uncharacterized protein n=1 Tax=Brachionus plicatilis TaxID=10195 RepID=A0A3M7QFI0_BRAPC|nr:hypothetical protein BpHYR1_032279 [Brachionus plicatilis]